MTLMINPDPDESSLDTEEALALTPKTFVGCISLHLSTVPI